MPKKRPYIVNIQWETEIDVLSFGTSKADAENKVREKVGSRGDLGLSDEYTSQFIYAKRQIRALEEVPNEIVEKDTNIIDDDLVFGLEDEESIFDYFKEEAKKEAQRKLDESHHHFHFWEETKTDEKEKPS